MKYLKKIAKWALFAVIVTISVDKLIALGHQYKLDAAGWASWVQAVGSIAALAVAIFVMSQQNAHATRLALSADTKALRRRGESVLVLIQHSYSVLGTAKNLIEAVLDDGTTVDAIDMALKVSRGKLEEVRRVLVSVPAHELGAFEMTASLQKAIGAITEVLHMVEPQDYNDLYHLRDQFLQTLNLQFVSVGSAAELFDASLQAIR